LATIIDGKAFSANLRGEIARKVGILKQEHSLTPGLAVVLVGEDPASQVYVRSKGRQTQEAGMNSYEHKLEVNTSQDDLLALIDKLNNDPDVHGILVQLPLPGHIDEEAVINSISVDKDVDGFHLSNVGRLSIGADGIVPCTPLGSLMMLKDHLGDLSGKKAIIVGRSNIVGKPMAALLLKESCTVTIAHSRTKWSRATGSSPALRLSMSASIALKTKMVRLGWWATSNSIARTKLPVRLHRCPVV